VTVYRELPYGTFKHVLIGKRGRAAEEWFLLNIHWQGSRLERLWAARPLVIKEIE
jgi:hypothetical protein